MIGSRLDGVEVGPVVSRALRQHRSGVVALPYKLFEFGDDGFAGTWGGGGALRLTHVEVIRPCLPIDPFRRLERQSRRLRWLLFLDALAFGYCYCWWGVGW